MTMALLVQNTGLRTLSSRLVGSSSSSSSRNNNGPLRGRRKGSGKMTSQRKRGCRPPIPGRTMELDMDTLQALVVPRARARARARVNPRLNGSKQTLQVIPYHRPLHRNRNRNLNLNLNLNLNAAPKLRPITRIILQPHRASQPRTDAPPRRPHRPDRRRPNAGTRRRTSACGFRPSAVPSPSPRRRQRPFSLMHRRCRPATDTDKDKDKETDTDKDADTGAIHQHQISSQRPWTRS